MLSALTPAAALAAPLVILNPDFTAADHSAVYPSSGGIGPLGLGFAPNGDLFAVDAQDNSLYRTPAGGGTATRIGSSLGPAVSGLTFGPDGRLYVVKGGNGPDIDEIDPATGVKIRSIVKATDIPGPSGIATDPVSGDLFVAASNGIVYRIADPETADPVVSPYRLVPAGGALHQMQITPDGTIWVNAGTQIFKLSGVGLPADMQSVVSQTNLVGFVVVMDRDASGTQVARFIYANRSDGVITKIDILRARRMDVVSGGSRGDYAVIGPDKCLYATQTSSVLRVTGGMTAGLCDLAAAGEAAPTLELSWGGAPPRVGSSPETVTARFASSTTSISNRPVTFTITGANPGSFTVNTNSSGLATLVYDALAPGLDTITATAVPQFGAPIDSINSVSITWLPALDLTGPVITPVVTGTPSTKSFGCPDYAGGLTAQTTHCGFFVTPPSITWQIVDPQTGIDLTQTNNVNCPNYPSPYTLTGNSPPTGTPVTCVAWNTDGVSSIKTVILNAIVTPPVITATRTPAANAAGWNNTDVTVTFNCTWPAGDFSADICTAAQTFTAETASAIANGVAEDVAGNRSTIAVPVKIDRTPPTITAAVTPAPGASGWNSGPVTVTFTCTDAGTIRSLIATCAAPVNVSAEGTTTVTGQATDVAGNTTQTSVVVKIDISGPRVTAAADRAPNASGWYSDDVVVSFNCTPGPSGAALTACTTPITLTSEGAAQAVTGSATDQGGQVTSATLAINLDRSDPVVTGLASPAANAAGWNNTPVTVTFTCTDAVSAIATCSGPVTLSQEGTSSATGSATDLAGNTASATVSDVRIDLTAPTSAAPTLTGLEIGGVYKRSVDIGFAATDARSGVASITYSASGAQPVSPTTASGSSASLLIDAEGTTTITYFATDAAGNAEAPRTLTVTVVHSVATTIVFGGTGTFTYDANPRIATARATAPGLDEPLGVTYTPGGSAPVNAGTYTVSASFAGSGQYEPATGDATITIAKAPAPVSWPAPAPLTYGTGLSAAQLSATATIPGTYTYLPAFGTVLGAGTNTLQLVFTPADTMNYQTLTLTRTVEVAKATPVVSWGAIAGITYGTALSSTQLNATSSVPGTFTYTPSAGTVLGAGTHPLSVTFTPADAANYASVTAASSITVAKAAVVVTVQPVSATYSGTAHATTAQVTGPGGLSASLPVSYSGGAAPISAGSYTASASYAGGPNHLTGSGSAAITITKATPQLGWSAPAPIVFGTALSATQLNATANVPGTFAYTPSAGTVLAAGTRTLSVTFTPTDTSNYTSAVKTVDLTVDRAPTSVQWADPTAITYGTPLGAAQLNATATPNVPGTFAYTPTAGTLLGVGTATLQVTFTPTDTSYSPSSRSVTIAVTKAASTVTVPAQTAMYDGQPHAATARATGPGGLDVPVTSLTYNGSPTPPTAEGIYTVVATWAGGPNHTGSTGTGTFRITPAERATTTTVTATRLPDGRFSVVATVTSDGVPVSGATVTFTSAPASQTFTATTGASGTASVTMLLPPPAAYTITASSARFQPTPASPAYLASSGSTGAGAVAVGNMCGRIRSNELTVAGVGKVKIDIRCDGTTVTGTLIYGKNNTTVTNWTGFLISTDQHTAWAFGRTAAGEAVVVRADDVGNNNDVLFIQIGGTVTTDGTLGRGNLYVDGTASTGLCPF